MNIIIEGTDGCGKTTTIEALKTMFPKANFSDRNHDTICKYMLKDVDMKTRIDATVCAFDNDIHCYSFY